MTGRALRFIGIVLLCSGFTLWAYGFVYSSFWYANAGTSILEPVRVWASEFTKSPVLPGMVEEVIGLAAALAGILLQIMSYYGKGKRFEV